MSVNHISEEQLVELLLEDSSQGPQMRAHLNLCTECRNRAEAIAETLRIVSAEPVPLADVERNWCAVRPHLQPLGSETTRTRGLRGWLWPSFAVSLATIVLLVLGFLLANRSFTPASPTARIQDPQPLPAGEVTQSTTVQLTDAERFLTALNHLSGPLDPDTRAQAHALLLHNALYVRNARARGQFGEAIVFENLGRVLTSVEAAPPTSHAILQFQKDWNIAGLLLEMRLLQQDKRADRPSPVEEYQ